MRVRLKSKNLRAIAQSYKCCYLQAKVRAIKSFTLAKDDFKSLMNSPNIKDALAFLMQYAYYSDIAEKSSNAEDFERNAITKDALLFKALARMAPFNLARIFELKASRLLLSVVEPEVELLLKENDFENMLKKAPDEQARAALENAIKEYEKTGKIFIFRKSLEQYFYENVLRFANKDVASFVSKEIDYYNVMSCLKAKNAGIENPIDLVIPLGTMKPDDIISCVEAGRLDGLDINAENVEVEFEKRLLLRTYKAFHYAYPRLQLVVYSFILLKEFETKNIARILAGIQQGLGTEDLLEVVAL